MPNVTAQTTLTSEVEVRRAPKYSVIEAELEHTATGFELYIKSPIIAKYMKALNATAGYEPITCRVGGNDEQRLKVYKWTDQWGAVFSKNASQDHPLCFNAVEGNFSYNGYLNFSILRLVDLETGIKIKFSGMATEEFCEEYLKALKIVATNVDQAMNKKFKYRLEVSMVEISIV